MVAAAEYGRAEGADYCNLIGWVVDCFQAVEKVSYLLGLEDEGGVFEAKGDIFLLRARVRG